MKKNIKRILLYVIASIVVVFLVIWGAALIKCEILTHKYYDEFKLVYQNNIMISDVKRFKVLNCDGDTAEVYYVSDICGDVLEFVNLNGNWIETEWRTVWSKSGNASNIVWPYWWQIFITGL